MILITIFASVLLTSSVEAHKLSNTINFDKHTIALDTTALGSSSRTPSEAESKKKKDDDNPLGGVIFGCLLWMLIPICLWQNERIAVNQYKMQMKAERWAIVVDDTNVEPLESMNGRMIFMTGESTCSQELADSQFPKVKSNNKIKLRRVFQMFQNIEHEKSKDNDNDEKVYYYTQDWSDKYETCPHDNSKKNDPFPINSTKRTEQAYRAFALSGNGDKCAEADPGNVNLGKYYLGEWVIRELQKWEPKQDVAEDMLEVKSPASGTAEKFKGDVVKKDGWFYFRGNSSDELGNVRVRFEELSCGDLTLCGVLAKDKVGWTLVPVIRSDSVSGEACMAEFGKDCCACCFRVKELRYGEEESKDKEFEDILKERPVELDNDELRDFKKAEKAYDLVDKYKPEHEGGPTTELVKKAMEFFGLEDEFLAVAEEDKKKSNLFKEESKSAETRHHIARVLGFFGLLLATNSIISPAIKLLNYNWLVSLAGGALLSVFICCTSCLCTIMCYCCIVSCAWIRYRPLLGTFGLACSALAGYGLYMYLAAAESGAAGNPGPSIPAPAFLARLSH